VKVVLDENLAPALARALDALFKGEHTVIHLRDKYSRGTTDQQWITDLSQDGQWVVISGDRRITRNRAEYQAFRNSRLIGFFLSKGLYKARVAKQMERLLALWENVTTLANSVEGGAMFELPMKGSRARQLRL
jgi:hypothetical protein